MPETGKGTEGNRLVYNVIMKGGYTVNKRELLAKKFLALAEEFNLQGFFFSGLLDSGEATCLCKIHPDVQITLSLFTLMIANIPDIYEMFNATVFQVFMEYFKEASENKKATAKGSSVLDEFKIEGKFKN